jgi:PKHD-type hydroxylase
MILEIGSVLSVDDLTMVSSIVAGIAFEDGRATAGWAAKGVKDNEQAAQGRTLSALRDLLAHRILANDVFALAVRPKQLTPLLVSRYGAGQHYGTHVDDPIMGGMRTDVSCTLFLSDPESYEGGELVIETSSGEEAFKLAAGSLVVYPSTALHRVEAVTRGERLAAVGWVRSLVRSAEQREILFDLDRARRGLFAREGSTSEFNLLSKSHANLMRMWIED